MVRSPASTVNAYLRGLPADRRAVVSAVRSAIREHLPKGYVESMRWGMISYEIPLERYPDTYNGQPLLYAARAAQKHYYVLYLMCVYQDPKLERLLTDGFASAGTKLDMGKSCVRFRTIDDLPLDVVKRIVAGTSSDRFIAQYERARKPSSRKRT
jgi:hypothetical protein